MVQALGQRIYRWRRNRRLRRIRRRMAGVWGRKRRRLLRARRAAGWMLAAALLILFLRTGAGRTALEGLRDGLGGLLTLEWIAESGTGVKPEGEFTEEGIQIRLDEMRILFFRIRREEEKGQMPPEERQ